MCRGAPPEPTSRPGHTLPASLERERTCSKPTIIISINVMRHETGRAKEVKKINLLGPRYTRFRQRSPFSGNIVRSPETCPRKLPVYIVLPWFQPALVAAAACVSMFSADKIIPMKRSRLGHCCVVPGCSLRSGTNLLSEVRTFCFPRDEGRRSAWLAAIKRENWTPTNSAQICSAHFIKGK